MTGHMSYVARKEMKLASPFQMHGSVHANFENARIKLIQTFGAHQTVFERNIIGKDNKLLRYDA